MQSVFWIFLLSILNGALSRETPKPKCEKITSHMCNDLPYIVTSFPNLVGDENEREAQDALSTFDPLIKVGCSEQLKFFLCSVYFPMCNDKVPFPIGPCRPLCESVKNRCLPVLKDFGFTWPHTMNCSKFPLENNDDTMCMPGPTEEGAIVDNPPEEPEWPTATSGCPPHHIYFNRTAVCVPLCKSDQNVKQSDRQSATTSLFFTSVTSLILTSVCLLLFFSRPRSLTAYPERCLLYSACAFMLSSVIYLFSLLYWEEIACTDYSTHSVSVSADLPHSPCSAFSALLYYFGTVGRFWWFAMCCGWNQLTTRNNYFERHRVQVSLLCWSLPLLAVMLALMARSVQTDQLSGICLIGSSAKAVDGVLSVGREVILLLSCSIPLLLGCLSSVGSLSPQPSSQTGLIACVYPVAALFYMLSCAHDWMQPSLQWNRTWNIVSAIKLLLDPFLACASAFACLSLIIINVYRDIRSPGGYKAGYQMAVPQVPQRPQPEVPIPQSAYLTNTYRSTPIHTAS